MVTGVPPMIGRAGRRLPPGRRAVEAADRLEREGGPAGQHIMAAVGGDEQPSVADLARQLPGLPDGDERVAVAAGHEGRRRDRSGARPASAAAGRRCRPRSPAAGVARLPGPAPGRSCRSISAAQAGSSRAIRSGSISRRPTLARGSRAVVIPTTTRVRTRAGCADREPERRHRPHRVADQVEGRETERVGEGLEVVDQPAGLEPVRRVPARPAVAARVRQVQAERLGEGRDLGAERAAPRRRRRRGA